MVASERGIMPASVWAGAVADVVLSAETVGFSGITFELSATVWLSIAEFSSEVPDSVCFVQAVKASRQAIKRAILRFIRNLRHGKIM